MALPRSDFKTAIKWITVGLIQSPNAIYRREIGTASGNMRTLTPHELATALAYTYTGTTPSEELLTQADNGTISDPVATAKTLLATARGKESMQHFFESWLDYPRAASLEKQNISTYANVRGDMVQETRAFIDDVVIQKRGGLRELLTATTTNPSTALAQYYGFPAPAASYATITRPTGQGIGILAQGSVMAARAKSNSSSPTERGLLVYLRLLCETKPQLPDVVPPIGEPAPGQITTRQRYEMQHAVGGCAVCHKRFDPIGFGFEHFDEGGRYRQDESGLAINSASAVPGPNDQPLFQFTDQESLVNGLVRAADRLPVHVGLPRDLRVRHRRRLPGRGADRQPAGGDGRHRGFVRGAGGPAALLDAPGAVARPASAAFITHHGRAARVATAALGASDGRVMYPSAAVTAAAITDPVPGRDMRSLLPDELASWVAATGAPAYRGEQIFRWLHGTRRPGRRRDDQRPDRRCARRWSASTRWRRWRSRRCRRRATARASSASGPTTGATSNRC